MLDLYQIVTDQVIAMLDAGVVPWRSPILIHAAGSPKNLVTGKEYRGINYFLLGFSAHVKGYTSAYWCTFNQAKERGGTVKKGEKATQIVSAAGQAQRSADWIRNERTFEKV